MGTWFWVTSVLASFAILTGGAPSSAQAAPPSRHIEVFAWVHERAPAIDPTWIKMPLPWTLATDSSGKTFMADHRGRMDLTFARGDVRVRLDSAYFEIRRSGESYDKIIRAAEIGAGAEVIFNEQDAPLGARMARAHLERARAAVLSALPPGVDRSWFDRPVTAEIDFDRGCNAAWNESKLLFNQGDERCEPAAHVADMMYHEYGHGVLQHLAPAGRRGAIDDRYFEGFADTLSLLLTGDPRFSRGFWKNRATTWLRDHSQPKAYPRDYRGTYTGAGIFSSAWFELKEALSAQLGAKTGSRLALEALLSAAADYQPGRGDDAFLLTGQLSWQAMSANPKIAGVPGFSCTTRSILAAHGLVEPGYDCARLAIEAAPGAILVTNLGARATPTLEARGPAFRSRLRSIAPGQTLTVRVPAPFGTPCGSSFTQSIGLRSPQGELLGQAHVTSWKGVAMDEPREILVDLLAGGETALPIPEPSAPRASGAWLELPFEAGLSQGERIIGAQLELQSDHPYPDDLLIGWRDPDGQQTELFKGEEELPIPAALSVPDLALEGSILVRDLVRDKNMGLSGNVTSASLRIWAARVKCGR